MIFLFSHQISLLHVNKCTERQRPFFIQQYTKEYWMEVPLLASCLASNPDQWKCKRGGF